MTDIIERLRDAAVFGPMPCPVCDEAADEIERLRKERDELTEYIAKHNELVKKMTIELAEYQVKEHKVGIKRAALAELGAEKTGGK